VYPDAHYPRPREGSNDADQHKDPDRQPPLPSKEDVIEKEKAKQPNKGSGGQPSGGEIAPEVLAEEERIRKMWERQWEQDEKKRQQSADEELPAEDTHAEPAPGTNEPDGENQDERSDQTPSWLDSLLRSQVDRLIFLEDLRREIRNALLRGPFPPAKNGPKPLPLPPPPIPVFP
jgi:hypothetical protein